jgi:hypothetical protein
VGLVAAVESAPRPWPRSATTSASAKSRWPRP